VRNSAAVIALVLALPSPGSPALGPSYGGRIEIGLDAVPAGFVPAPARTAGARLLSGLVHETLVTVSPDGAPSPALAAGWSVTGRELTIGLRPGALFHDGTPITSADVVRSLQRFLRSTSPAAAWLAPHVTGLAAADPLRVVLTVDENRHGVLEALAAPAAAMTSARGAGAGPFVPTTNAPVGQRLTLVHFAHHVRGRPFLDAIDVRVGGSDVQPSATTGARLGTLLLVIDPHGGLASEDARRAVRGAVDGADLARNFWPGAAAAGSLLPPAILLAPPVPPSAPPARGSGTLALRVGPDVPVAVGQRVAALLGSAGFTVRASAARPEDVAPAGGVRLIAWTPEVADPLLALEELAALAPAAATSAVRDLLNAAAREPDADRRHVLILRAEAALRAGSILVPIAAVPVGFQARAGVQGVTVDEAGRIRLEDAWIAP
jgi:ABC-type transport system substrate-binding protein